MVAQLTFFLKTFLRTTYSIFFLRNSLHRIISYRQTEIQHWRVCSGLTTLESELHTESFLHIFNFLSEVEMLSITLLLLLLSLQLYQMYKFFTHSLCLKFQEWYGRNQLLEIINFFYYKTEGQFGMRLWDTKQFNSNEDEVKIQKMHKICNCNNAF